MTPHDRTDNCWTRSIRSDSRSYIISYFKTYFGRHAGVVATISVHIYLVDHERSMIQPNGNAQSLGSRESGNLPLCFRVNRDGRTFLAGTEHLGSRPPDRVTASLSLCNVGL